MKHPTSEEWMEFLYDESTPVRKTELTRHLADCGTCRAHVNEWRGGMATLDSWQIPAAKSVPRGHRFVPLLKWAAAAMLFASAGFAAARFAPAIDAQSLRTQIEEPIRRRMEQDLKQVVATEFRREWDEASSSLQTHLLQDLRDSQAQSLTALAKAQGTTQQMLAELARTYSENRAEDQKEWVATLQRMQTQHLTDLRTLRKELETVAVQTEDSLQKAETQLVRLATLTQPTPEPNAAGN
jgi:hypothetical protein